MTTTEVAAKTPKKRGRKTKLDPEVTKTIREAIERGNTVKNAAALAGISERVVYNWLEWGKEGKDSEYLQFMQEVNRAQANAQDRAVRAFVGAFSDDPRMAMEYLARRYPEDWAKKDNLKVEAKHDGEIVVKVKRIDSNGNTI